MSRTLQKLFYGEITGLLLAALCLSSSHAATINVPADQPTIQAGINAANAGDTVLVADGTYSGDGNRDISLQGKQLVIMSENGPESTIIDCGGSQPEPHRGFLFNSGEDTTTVLSGFTIQNGYGPPDGPRGELVGGGISIRSSSPTIENCILRGNKANNGAGLFCRSSSSLIRNCLFDGDTAETFPTLGGGASLTGNSSIEFSDCDFRKNCSSSGGGIYCDSSFMELTNCAFDTNLAAGGGGITLFHATANLDSCSFDFNFGFGEFGEVGGGILSIFSIMTARGCLFVRNNASGGGGGGISIVDSSFVELDGCIFIENVATAGGAIACVNLSSVVIRECNFESNWASFGAGINSRQATVSVTNSAFLNGAAWRGGAGIRLVDAVSARIDQSVFAGNWSRTGSSLYFTGSSPIVSNCTFTADSTELDSGVVHCQAGSYPVFNNSLLTFSSAGAAVTCEDSSQAVFVCSDIFGNAGGDWIGCIAAQGSLNGNISADPLFCDPAAPDFSLRPASPCLPANNRCGVLIGAVDSTCLPTDVEDDNPTLPREFLLEQNYPNPFNPSTTISFSLPSRAHVKLTVTNILGEHIKTLLDKSLSAGTHTIQWNGIDDHGNPVSTGIYFYQLKGGQAAESKKMILLK